VLYNVATGSDFAQVKTIDDLLKPQYKGRFGTTAFVNGFDAMSAKGWEGEAKMADYIPKLGKQAQGVLNCGGQDRVASGEFQALVLDVGANVDCTAQNLQQFAVMGEIYFRSMFPAGRRPRVGLLSIGEEETKGNDLTRESFQLLKNLPLNFIGNVEGRDLYNGHVDVIVADGFVGNVALKISEGVANLVRTVLKESLKTTITRQVGALLSRSAFTDFKKRLDHTEYGGAPLLGVKGVCIITHGSSNANAIKNAVRVAAEFADRGINESIERGLAALRPAQEVAAEVAAPAALAPSGS